MPERVYINENGIGEEGMPKDPVMLLSFVNMKLRDFYSDIEGLCMDYDVTKEELCEKLKTIDYEYDRTLNRFVSME